MKQAPPLVSRQLQKLVGDLRRRVPTLPTAAERFAMVRDVAIFCAAFHTTKGGFDLSVPAACQALQVSRAEGIVFNFLLGKTLRESSQAVVVVRNAGCREICAVAAMIEYRQAAASIQWALADGLGFIFPSVPVSGDKGHLALTTVRMTSNLQPICEQRVWSTSGTPCTPFGKGGRRVTTWMGRPWTSSWNTLGGGPWPWPAET